MELIKSTNLGFDNPNIPDSYRGWGGIRFLFRPQPY